jgi:hypothetical protein
VAAIQDVRAVINELPDRVEVPQWRQMIAAENNGIHVPLAATRDETTAEVVRLALHLLVREHGGLVLDAGNEHFSDGTREQALTELHRQAL